MATPTPSRTSFVFLGDSVTDCGRQLPASQPLGDGYVRLLSERLASSDHEVNIINNGVNGSRVSDLLNRIRADLPERADIVTVLIGVNDTWRRFDSGLMTTAASYEADYRAVVARIKETGCRHLVLMEPFLLPQNDDQAAWREDLDPKIEAVHRIASDSRATLVPLDLEFTNAALAAVARGDRVAANLTADGVHPTPLGHRLIAQSWLRWTVALRAEVAGS